MFSTVYFAASSVLASPSIPDAIASKVLGGHLQDAAKLAANYADKDHDKDAADYASLQIHGDIELALGRYEEAEEAYRRAQKLIRNSRDAMRLVSCRNTGWQAFFRNQFNVALTCFKRVAEDKAVSAEHRMDSLVGATLVLFHLGCTQAACDRLAELVTLAEAGADRRWVALVDALRRDLLAQHDLHCSDKLADHIYWRSVVVDVQPHGLTALSAAAARSVAALPSLTLLTQRLDYLGHVKALAEGRADALSPLKSHLQWSQKNGIADYHRSLCLEVALAAVVAANPSLAETMLDESGAAAIRGNQHARWYLDYLYCRAKIMQQHMRTQEFAQMYGRYALASIQHVRSDNVSMPMMKTDTMQTAQHTQRSDDISARLPAKYRRAYRYMMDNLDQSDLSVREMAAHIGVTERAIQAAFKNHLGLSPSELIRRQRMERIRDDLLDDDAPASRVLDVAKKWGVQHRSTLINGYRRVFQEAPSETMGR
jgi:AraC-like DNA-binding protein